MSDTREIITHALLIEHAAKWLQKKGCAVVITDMSHGGAETADAIGWRGRFSILVECKASRADFLADARKSFRRFPPQGMGAKRYFCTMRGLLKPEELPSGWGLLEWDGRKLRIAKEADHQSHEPGAREEISLLLSAMRRLAGEKPAGVSVRCYTFESKNRATLGLALPSQGDQPTQKSVA